MSDVFSSAAAEFRMEVRNLRAFDDEDDCEDTASAIASLTPEAATRVLERAASRSGEHKLDLPSPPPVETFPPALERRR